MNGVHVQICIILRSGDYKLRICLDLHFYLLCFSDCCILSVDVYDEINTDKKKAQELTEANCSCYSGCAVPVLFIPVNP